MDSVLSSHTHTHTSNAPFSFINRTIGISVLPRTIESSTNTTRFPAKFCDSTPNLRATADCRNAVDGCMNERPTYAFRFNTATYGRDSCILCLCVCMCHAPVVHSHVQRVWHYLARY